MSAISLLDYYCGFDAEAVPSNSKDLLDPASPNASDVDKVRLDICWLLLAGQACNS